MPESRRIVVDRWGHLRPAFVLSAGFGGLVLFLLAAAAGTIVRLDRVRGEEARIRQSYVERLRALEQIRGLIYRSGTEMRDYLLSPGAGSEAQRKDVLAIRAQTGAGLKSYSTKLDPAEQDAFTFLSSEIDAWWQAVDAAFQSGAGADPDTAYNFYYEQLVPRRTTMLQIADSIAQINQQGLNRSEEALAASAGKLRLSLLVTFGVALAGSVLLATLTTLITLRLERRVEQQLSETMAARSDLEALSARMEQAQEDERRSLARELHDEVGQSLSAIMMEASGAMTAAGVADATRSRLASIESLAARTLNNVRDLALLLRPSMLDDFGLIPALNWHARETGKRTGLHVNIATDRLTRDLPDEQRTCVYRVVQEAIHNAARHARARTVQVDVRDDGSQVVFSVRDDGIGFNKAANRGLGLLGMEERVRRLGGRLRIDTQQGRGTTVTAELPLPDVEKLGAA